MDVLLVCWDTKPVITPGGRLGLNRYEVLLGSRWKPSAQPSSQGFPVPDADTTSGGHRSREQDGAICSNADVCSPLGASHASMSGERPASSCSAANTWN